MAQSVGLAWLYNGARASILLVALAHAAINLAPEPWAAAWRLLPEGERGPYPSVLIAAVWVLAAALLIALAEPRTLTRRRDVGLRTASAGMEWAPSRRAGNETEGVVRCHAPHTANRCQNPPGRTRVPSGPRGRAAGCWGSRPGCCSRPPSPRAGAGAGPAAPPRRRGPTRPPWTRCSPPASPGGCPGSPCASTAAGRPSSRGRPGSPAGSGRPRCGTPTASASTASPRPSPPPSSCSWSTRGCSPWTTPSAGGWTTRRWRASRTSSAITLRQLLTHTSGIYDYQDETDSPFYGDAFFGPGADWARVWTPPELLAYADGARHAPYFAPGQGVAYANTNYVLLGLIVEAATGRPFGDELRDRILGPLALDHTSLEEGAALAPDVVHGYQRSEGQLVNVSAVNLTWAWAAGGVVSTAADLARFARAVFGGELLSPAAHQAMFTFVPGTWGRLEFGMGVYRVPSPNGELIGMDGGGAGGTSTMIRLPAADVTVVALANAAGDGGLDHHPRRGVRLGPGLAGGGSTRAPGQREEGTR